MMMTSAIISFHLVLVAEGRFTAILSIISLFSSCLLLFNCSSDGSRPPSPIPSAGPSGISSSIVAGVGDKDPFPLPADIPDLNAVQADIQAPTESAVDKNAEAAEPNDAIPNTDQTTLLQNEEESFALAPVDASALRGTCGFHFFVIIHVLVLW